jgi:hypothetical protein
MLTEHWGSDVESSDIRNGANSAMFVESETFVIWQIPQGE